METGFGVWRVLARMPGWPEGAGALAERYEVLRETDGRRSVLTLHPEGEEPDPEIQAALRALGPTHAPELLEAGRRGDQAYEVFDEPCGGNLASLDLPPEDRAALRGIVAEIGGALAAFAERGLRHRNLRPELILIRSREPLDLVVTGFGSARISEHGLDIAAPLEASRYAAPEALVGAVAAASDWWSLGVVLLEKLTRGACFAGAGDQAFLISLLAAGASIPEGLPPETEALLRGLLATDRHERWGWPQVRRWLDGEIPQAPPRPGAGAQDQAARSILLGSERFSSAARFALAAADAGRWDEARRLLLRGEIALWMEEAGLSEDLRAEIRRIAGLENLSEDLRLALALKALNPAMPLVMRGEIVTPGWLQDHPEEGYALICGPAPDLLERMDSEVWLARLKRREIRIRDRARRLEVELDEPKFRALALSASKSRLLSVWERQRRLLPDTDHPGLLAIVERRISEEDDLILLLGAAASQFRSAEAIVEEAEALARGAGLGSIDHEAALARLALSPRDLHAELEARLSGFARCGLERLDEWADQFRLERRSPTARALAILATPEALWARPPQQAYVSSLMDFFARRIVGAIMRGPLTRMTVGRTAARLDLTELDNPRQSAKALLDHVLMRNDQKILLDPGPLMEDPALERRLRKLHAHASLHRRDTGVDGLYLGFPFLVLQEERTRTRPRIAPILLWPIRLDPELGSRGRISLAFDRDREEVRLNPAFETMLGVDAARLWREAADEALSRSSVDVAEMVEAFRGFAALAGRALAPLPSPNLTLRPGESRICCAAALFHLNFFGQAVMEDLRRLKAAQPEGSGLATALRIGEEARRAEPRAVPEAERYFTAESDPSQEAAVLEAREGRGLLIEGPPGTGKSQTIVNMVADAIGSGRSLLVVCQKQAALDVVHKRLEAVGLGGRVLMVGDVNKDREPVIRAVREQLDQLFQNPRDQSWLAQRSQTAARVEALERELDAQHRALHAVDPQTGLSYRRILGDLIGLGREGETLSLPILRRRLGGLDPGRLAALEEACAPVARFWLAARYEGSALVAARLFSPDEGEIAAFTEALDECSQLEAARLAVLERTPAALTLSDAEAWRRWSSAHGAAFLDLDAATRARLVRRIGRAAEFSESRSNLDELEEALRLPHQEEVPENAAETARGFSERELAVWSEISERLLRPSGFLGGLSPSRWLAARRLRALLRREGLAEASVFETALRQERALRPLRANLAESLRRLGEPADALSGFDKIRLREAARQARARLAEIEALFTRLEACPEPAVAFAMARAASRKAVEDLLRSVEQGVERQEARIAALKALNGLSPWMEALWIQSRAAAIAGDASNEEPLEAFRRDLPHLSAYQRFRARVPQLGEEGLALFAELSRIREILEAMEPEALDPALRRLIASEARLAWKSRLEAAEPALLREASELDSKIAALAAADREMRALNQRLLSEGPDAKRLQPPRAWEDITRLRGQRARRLREFVDRGADLGLMRLRPVWLMNPDTASRLLPMRKALFDVVVFDEASQTPVEYALPTLYRSRVAIISGDEKQMPPAAFFSSRVDSDEAEASDGPEEEDDLDEEERTAAAEGWNRREIKDCPDLLQLAKSVLPSATLQIHYRSVYRELIQFSNAAFYGGRLSVPARHPPDEVRRALPIEMIQAGGVYEAQTNPMEAERVVDALRDLLVAPAPPTLGVVTFNRKQADLIEEALEERAEADPELRLALTRERSRKESGEDVGFFVKNVENVQGDERDVILFSSTFGRDAQGAFRRFFGVLGQTGGERRLNVAITRAKQKVILVTSMPIPMISDFLSDRRQATGPRDYLQAYFEYARRASAGELESAEALLLRLAPERRSGSAGAAGRSADGLEEAVADEIRALGWEPRPVGDEGAFSLDFAVEDPKTGLYGLGVECDAPRHGLLKAARAREIWRRSVLRRSIPAIHRVSSQRWLHDPAQERGRLREAVLSAMGTKP